MIQYFTFYLIYAIILIYHILGGFSIMENEKNKKKIRINEELEFAALRSDNTDSKEKAEKIIDSLFDSSEDSNKSD